MQYVECVQSVCVLPVCCLCNVCVCVHTVGVSRFHLQLHLVKENMKGKNLAQGFLICYLQGLTIFWMLCILDVCVLFFFNFLFFSVVHSEGHFCKNSEWFSGNKIYKWADTVLFKVLYRARIVRQPIKEFPAFKFDITEKQRSLSLNQHSLPFSQPHSELLGSLPNSLAEGGGGRHWLHLEGCPHWGP